MYTCIYVCVEWRETGIQGASEQAREQAKEEGSKGERVSEVKGVSFLVFIVCHNKETGNTTQRGFYVCVRVCVRACGCHVDTTPSEPS